jgi:hypothetical protein
VFACRQCHCLAYVSQRENLIDRASSRADRVRARLKDEWGTLFDPAPPKPSGMHWRTYRRLAAQYEHARSVSLNSFASKYGIALDEAVGR